MTQTQIWKDAQQWEANWWGDCLNTFNEEVKQYIYAHYMGLNNYRTNYYGQRGWDFGDKTVLDVGCGPVSILLKSKAKYKVGVDPCKYPDWVLDRYEFAEVDFHLIPGEEMKFEYFDIGLLYNCLQHTINPEKIVNNMLRCCKVIHVFEWIDTGISDGHLHDLTEEKLSSWLKGEGKVIELNQSPCVGKAFAGIFKGYNYGK